MNSSQAVKLLAYDSKILEAVKMFLIFLTCLTSGGYAQDFSECGRTLDNHNISNTGKTEYNAAMEGEFPYMCTLFTKVDGYNIFLGGASLIAENQLLTLATAVYKLRKLDFEASKDAEKSDIKMCEESHQVFRSLSVTCGDSDLQSKENEAKQTTKVSKIIVHPNYNPKSLIHDIAILIVEEPFKYSKEVGPVCLPRPNQEPVEGSLCIATGHGRDTFGFGAFSQKLRKVSLPLWNSNQCESTLNDKFFSNKTIDWKIHPSFLCAGGKKDSDTCEGDGGGPLVCYDTSLQSNGVNDNDIFDVDEVDLRTGNSNIGKIVQVGVTAWGIECAREGMPSVYSSVTDARCWIDQISSCYGLNKPEDATDGNIDLRTIDDSPESVGEMTDVECGEWLQSEESNRAACGCKQILANGDSKIQEAQDYDIRSVDKSLDLRTIE